MTRLALGPIAGRGRYRRGSVTTAIHLCLSLALWNGEDPILKERFFGLTNLQGKHGEDVKEYYYHLDNTPTHSYMRMLYKYPQAAYPYEDLMITNRGRTPTISSTSCWYRGVRRNRYFDVEIEYAKVDPEDIVAKVTVTNRGAEDVALEVLACIWFRNTWSAGLADPLPVLAMDAPGRILAEHQNLGRRVLCVDESAECLFTNNETNSGRIFGTDNGTPFVKDGINDYVVHGRLGAVNPARTGTKAAARHRLVVSGGASISLRWRLRPPDAAPIEGGELGPDLDAVMAKRRTEADEFYQSITPPAVTDDDAMIMRRALAGMLWSKQFYYFDLDRWLQEHDGHPLRSPKYDDMRNQQWFHMQNGHILSMPDCWEYPWYAAWDLAFHCVALEHGRPGVHPPPDRAHDQRRLPAPERSNPGLRVELRGRQPTRSRLGDLVCLRGRDGAAL